MLQRLLTLKRFEQPPPGYFDRLSASVTAKIRAEEARRPWWQRWLDRWEFRPAFSGATAAMALGVYLIGLGLVHRYDSPPVADARGAQIPSRAYVSAPVSPFPAWPAVDARTITDAHRDPALLPAAYPENASMPFSTLVGYEVPR